MRPADTQLLLSPPSRTSSEATLVAAQPDGAAAAASLASGPSGQSLQRKAQYRALVVSLYVVSSSAVALLARRLSATAPSLRYRAQLLPSVGFAIMTLGAILPQALPHISARLGIEVSNTSRGSSAALVKRALPIGACAAAAAWCAVQIPNAVAIESEEALTHFASPIVLLATPILFLASPSDRLRHITAAISALFAYALLSVSMTPDGALLTASYALLNGLFAVLSAKWLSCTSKLMFTSAYAPVACLLSLIPTVANTRPQTGMGWRSATSWIRYEPVVPQPMGKWYAGFITAFVAEQAATVVALQNLPSPLHVTLLSLPRALSIFFVTRHKSDDHQLGLAFSIGVILWLWADEEASPWHIWQSWRAVSTEVLPISQSEKQQSVLEDRELTSTGGRSPHSVTRNTAWMLASLAPFAFFLVRAFKGEQMDPDYGTAISTAVVSKTGFPSLDLIYSYYDQQVDSFADHIAYMRKVEAIAVREPRVIVYTKSRPGSLSEFAAQVGADEVHVLPNIGREGHTYLVHILRNYGKPPNPTTGAGGLADQIAFCQDHLSWHGVAEERLQLLTQDTGYLHFAPYVISDCGRDLMNNITFPRMRDIYTLFREELCPPSGQLSAWSAQFFVSKRRILENSLSKYKRMLQILEVPSGHWLHSDQPGAFSWGESGYGPSNPYIGHALERSWPFIFACNDPSLAERCPLDAWDRDLCQCFDR